jgi:DNA repair protein RecN (Recombination protein N)
MLNHITIKNLAVVDTLELELEPGLSVLTGETGAGKSILIDALGLVLGDRADAAAVRYGAERAEIIADFDISQSARTMDWLITSELDSDNECLVRRTINAGGRSRGYINGQPVPLQILRELGEQLVNIHGQNTHQALLKQDEQRFLLDSFAAARAQHKTVNSLYLQWKSTTSRFRQLQQDNADKNAKLELLRFQVEELENFAVQEDELQSIEEEYTRLSNANRLIEISQSIRYQLQNDEQNSITQNLNHCLNELGEASALDTTLQPVAEYLNNALIQIDEAGSDLRDYLDALELDPERLQWLNDRISDYYDLCRKHRIETDELFSHAEKLCVELDQIENADSHLEMLQLEVEQYKSDYFKAAEKLSKARTRAASLLAEQVEKHIHQLGMEHCVFQIQLQPLAAEQPRPDGMESIAFHVSTNPGQPPKALSKVVSGGELSRISLAIQVVTAQFSDVPTLIFDEVDVGIGGGIAAMVGNKLRLLGEDAQILCVTHQAQIASQAHHHLNVLKESDENSTSTSISVLNEEQRIEELSRMMGGIKITRQTRSHAREMRKQVIAS